MMRSILFALLIGCLVACSRPSSTPSMEETATVSQLCRELHGMNGIQASKYLSDKGATMLSWRVTVIALRDCE